MQLLIQPDDGAGPVIAAIDKARTSIDMYVFRLSHPDIEAAIASAVERGVAVRTLVAHTRSGGKESMRKLESRLLKIGTSVSRTDDDLLRYHGKMMVVDGRRLFVLGFNFTRRDIEESRSLGVVIDDPKLVIEALRLFDADFSRQTYAPRLDAFLVSPLNARASLLELIVGARERLLIYDSRLSDSLMQKAIERSALGGVDVRVIGRMEKSLQNVRVEPSPSDRLHVRAIVQDDRRVFIGSQSLRRRELEKRREIGVILNDPAVVCEVAAIFETDWTEGTGEEMPDAVVRVA